jgi:anti-sigma factor RsiW
MTCANCLEMLSSYIDGELSADESAQVREHLQSCADCAREHRKLLDTSSLVRGRLMRYEAPDVLKARIRAGLVGSPREVEPRPANLPGKRRRDWVRGFAAAAVVAMVSSALTVVAVRQGTPDNSVANQVLTSHIRSLMPGHLTDVASNDQHNVKPWFNGRVNVSPAVPRLDSVGFPLIGGRLDYIDGHSAASVVYMRRQHVINVFSWPVAGRNGETAATTSNGYNLIGTSKNGVETWFVSDLNIAELKDFAGRFERASAGTSPATK